MMLIFAFLSLVWAAEPASLVRFYPGEVLRNETVEFKPVDNHHFSFEAPQNCGSGSLNEKTPRTIKCQFLQAGETQATLNICDDKKTFCKPVQLKVNVVQREGADAAALKKNEHLNKELKKTLIAGFAEGTSEEVTAKAAQLHQPVLVMVSTDWCPPCNESKEYLLPSETFKSATKDWYKVYVDGDSIGAAAWEKAVPYHYFPSYILLNSKMEEIGRFNGELRQGEFAAWAKTQSEFLNDPIRDLKERVMARLAGQWSQKIKDLWHRVSAEKIHRDNDRLLNWALDQEDKDLVAQLVAEGDYPTQRAQILQFQLNELNRIATAQKKDLKAEKTKIHQALLQETFAGEHWSTHLEEYCEMDATACKPYVAKIPERLAFLEKRTGLQDAERESLLGDEYYYITQTYQTLEEKTALKEFAVKCVDHFEAMQKNSKLKISRSGYQGMVACLELAEAFPREEKVLNALIEAYPNEPTFKWRMARMLRKQKKFDDALVWIAKAETLAYGYNWFSLQLLKAEILLSQKKREEAKQVVQATLAQIQLDSSTESRNQRLVARLRNLQISASEVSQN
ncbi:MAG: hypothetical protein ACXVA9_00835 [Bdellovibrionales bacterium]